MSNKLNWAINIAFLLLIFAVLFNRWVGLIFGFAFILAYAAYFLVQFIRHRGGDERSRHKWNRGPDWWLRFARDDYAQPKKKANPPPPPKS